MIPAPLIRSIVTILLFALTAGCSALHQPNPNAINNLYRDQIIEWQKRIAEQGWVENLVDDVVNGCIRFSKYEKERGDHWATPKEFREKGFKGDCEDIAVFTMGTLKNLNYPHKVRILAVRTLTGDHAILKIEVPGELSKRWKIYETVPVPLVEFDQLFYRPIVEFDDKEIFYF